MSASSLHETPAGLGVLRVTRVDRDGRIARLAGVEARERSRKHVKAPGEELHQLAGVRLPSGGQSRTETLSRRRGRAQAIEVLDQAEHGVPFVRLPERGVACFLQGILLRRVPGPDALRERRKLGTQVGGLGFRSLRFECDARHGQIRRRGRWRDCRRLLFGVRIDERDVKARSFSRCDEEELVARGKLALDDRRGDPRQEVPLYGALERAGTQLRTEPLLDEVVDSGLVPLHGPRLHPEAAPVEDVGELLLEQAAHDVTAERAEDDDAVEAVQELGSERPADGLDDLAGVELAGSRRRTPRPVPSGSPSRGSR